MLHISVGRVAATLVVDKCQQICRSGIELMGIRYLWGVDKTKKVKTDL